MDDAEKARLTEICHALPEATSLVAPKRLARTLFDKQG